MRQPRRRYAIRSGINSELLGHGGEKLNGFLGDLAIAAFVGVGMQPQQCERRAGISGRSRRILERLPPCSQSAELQCSFKGSFGIEETAVDGVMEATDHLLGD